MKELIKFLFGSIKGIAVNIYYSWILTVMIGWFIPQLSNYIKISIPVIFGIMCIYDLLSYSPIDLKKKVDYSNSQKLNTETKIMEFIVYKIILPIIILLHAFIAKQFI